MAESAGRLFVAVALTDEVRYGLVAHLDEALGGRPVPGRPVPPENWHLTLRFLGKTDTVVYERIIAGLDQADLGGPFRLKLAGLGAFPRPQRATVLWVGIQEEGAARLGDLASRVESVVTDVGFMPEERPFHPHLTLSRIRPHQDVRPTIDAVPQVPLGQEVDEVVVYRSHLGRGPARYEVVERFPLG